MPGIPIQDVADMINADCQNLKFFWACGMVRETIKLWTEPDHYAMLCDDAKVMADHYINHPEVK